jgi:hypothetical protein
MRVAACMIAYNRPHYFRPVMESIAANPEARTIPIHFYLDGGRDAAQEENHRIIAESGLPNTHIVCRDGHFGCEANTIGAHCYLFSQTDCDVVLHLEDDLVLGPHYMGLMLRLLAWANANYDNVASVQAWNRCLLDVESKRSRLACVEPRCTSRHWWGYALTRRAWQAMLPVITEYRSRFLDGRSGNALDDEGVRAFIRSVVDGGPASPPGRVLTSPPWAEESFRHPHTATGNDAIHAVAMWKAGLVRVCTVVNRALAIGRVGLHGTEDFFDQTGFGDVKLDLFPEDETLDTFEVVEAQ